MTTVVEVRGLDQAIASFKSGAKQVRYAASVAVNKTAETVQTHTVTRLLPQKFTLRKRGAGWWQPRTALGFNIRFARRTDPEPTAVIGSRADWLLLQEEGGTKRAGSGKALSIAQTGGARPQKTDVVPARLKVKRLLARKRGQGFFLDTRHGPALFVRTGQRNLQLMHGFSDQAQIVRRLDFGPTETKVAEDVILHEFEQALVKAFATAR